MLAQAPVTIPKYTKRAPALDYDTLRKAGMDYLQKIAGKSWTDHNVHDAGITMWEELCYAMTDLAFRTSFDIRDILTTNIGEGPSKIHAFYTAKQILTSHPVTVADYRKMLIDNIPGLQNVWLKVLDNIDYTPAIYYNSVKKTLTKTYKAGQTEALQLKGIYAVRFEPGLYELLESYELIQINTMATDGAVTTAVPKNEFETKLATCICKLMRHNRNLCEDISDVRPIQEERVAVCADIELQPTADAQKVWLQIYRDLYNYISPFIPFYSIDELLAKGKTVDEIFQGSPAKRGFTDYDEIRQFDHRTVLYTSDMINIIMDIPGVLAIKDIHLSSYRKDGTGNFVIHQNAEKYCLHLTDELNYSFRLALDFNETDKKKQFNHIHFYKDYIFFSPKHDASYAIKDIIKQASFPTAFVNDMPVPDGSYRGVDEYISIQNEFPANYMIGQPDIPASATPLRKAQRLQLKGYLLFFEQLLSDYLAQLYHVRELFKWNTTTTSSYFFTDLRKVQHPFTGKKEINDIDKIIETYKSPAPGVSSYRTITENAKVYLDRRNRFLDHLLARFNEQFVDYSVLKFAQAESYSSTSLITDKINFLAHYPAISGNRSHAVDYSRPVTASDNISGYELRLNMMLGLPATSFKQLVKFKTDGMGNKVKVNGKYQVCYKNTSRFEDTFGLHVLEHILLRPQVDDYVDAPQGSSMLLQFNEPGTKSSSCCVIPDTYSMKLSVVLPGWLPATASMDFRSFVEQRIRSEAPAHVAIKICWLDPLQMDAFETAYTDFMSALLLLRQCVGNGVSANYKKALAAMVNLLPQLKNHYPPSILQSCMDVTFDSSGNTTTSPVILNRAALAGEQLYEFVDCGS